MMERRPRAPVPRSRAALAMARVAPAVTCCSSQHDTPASALADPHACSMVESVEGLQLLAATLAGSSNNKKPGPQLEAVLHLFSSQIHYWKRCLHGDASELQWQY